MTIVVIRCGPTVPRRHIVFRLALGLFEVLLAPLLLFIEGMARLVLSPFRR